MKKRSRLVALTALLLCMAMIWSCDAGGSMPTTSTSGTTGAGSTGNGTSQTTGGSVDPTDPTIDRIGREVDHLTLAQNGKTEYRLIYNLGMRGNKKDLVMHFAAQKLIKGNTIGLAGQIPQSDLNAGYAAALTGGTAKLLDLSENLVHITRIFTQNAALEH